jgi:cell division protease FtsH
MVTQFGMSEKLGIVALETPRTPAFLPVPAASTNKEYSEETARLIDEEIKRLLIDSQNKVREILSAHQPALEEVARLLLDKEVVERPELLSILKPRSIDGGKDKDKHPRDKPQMLNDGAP